MDQSIGPLTLSRVSSLLFGVPGYQIRLRVRMDDIQLAKESDFGLRRLSNAGGLNIGVLADGCLFAIDRGEILINQILGSPVAGGIHRIDLRVHRDREIRCIPIVGPAADTAFMLTDNQLCWNGEDRELKFRCVLAIHPTSDAWFYRVEIQNKTNQPLTCDAIMLQDVGLATRGQVRNNELFTSQYIDHFAAKHDDVGWVLMSRQNLPQPGDTHPWLMQGCFPKASGVVSDGFDFFGTRHRGNREPIALTHANIGTTIRQYEVSHTAIQSNRVQIEPSSSFAWTFFAEFSADHSDPSSHADLTRIDSLITIDEANGDRPAATHQTGTQPERSLFHTLRCLEAMIYPSAIWIGSFPARGATSNR